MLFHVEHFRGTPWFWRWRIVGDFPESYLRWREGFCCRDRQVLHCEIPGADLQVQWKSSESEDWIEADHCEPGIPTASFRMEAVEDISFPDGFRVMGVVSGMVACYQFGPLDLAAGVQVVMDGVADGPFLENFILRSGDFRTRSGLLHVESVSGSEGCFLPSQGQKRLSIAPGAEKRMLFAYGDRSLAMSPESEKGGGHA